MASNIWKYIESMCRSTGYYLVAAGKDKDDIKTMPGRIVIGKVDEYSDAEEQIVDAVTKFIKRTFRDSEIDRKMCADNNILRVNDVADNNTVMEYWVEAAISLALTMDEAETISSERRK